ncbi:Pol32 [Drosophila busckii]|uniref:Pol32 n=1 Tax=Drosophila busckii TaxID=30019 RepID=A0A0M4E7M7_DROBS|nr:enolase-phosphatase E1 [Drosophila busckii]XP_017854338.1 enolase-phosphatase E1 [Drosophila busckii]ALC38802.1 Pol32 [Drosophila busckii]
MSLQAALDDCLIDFDRRVLVTDLLETYKLTYKEAHEVLEAHIKQQESASATKYEKRFVVHGKQADSNAELYTIVQGEEKLKEWLGKLQNAESQLYSVEVAGGSKSAAPIFKPMKQLEVKLARVEQRASAKPNGVSNGVHKPAEVKAEDVKPNSSSKVEAPKPAAEAQKKASPPEQSGKGKAAKKGSISNFFGAAAAAKKEPAKETKPAAAKPSSMENFFKKQPAANNTKKSPESSSSTSVKKESLASNTKKSPESSSSDKKELLASNTKKSFKGSNSSSSFSHVKKESPAAKNTSVQLFLADSDNSSDEEEKMDKLRRNVIDSGDESDEASAKTSRSKRRRIEDSDDEEQPPKKTNEQEQSKQQEKPLEAMEVEQSATNETYLDEDGFVITIKSKKQNTQPAKKKTSPTATATAKATVAATKKKSPPAAKEAAKTKQGNIMSFFTKK